MPNQGAIEYIRWVDTTGRTWNLCDRAGGATLAGDSHAFHLPVFETYWVDLAGADGSVWYGHRVPRRDLNLPIIIERTPSMSWREVDSLFWKGFNPEKQGTLVVKAVGVPERFMTLRPQVSMEHVTNKDPGFKSRERYVCEFAVENPGWKEAAVSVTLGETAAQNWYPDAVRPAGLFFWAYDTTAIISNPGDSPSFLVWTITGPVDAADIMTITISGQVTQVRRGLAAGEVLVIDMRPESPMFGVYMQATGQFLPPLQVLAFAPAPLPAGGNQQVQVSLGPDSTTTVSFNPVFRRPW